LSAAAAVGIVLAAAVAAAVLPPSADAATAGSLNDRVAAAAAVATGQGYRTGVAVLDLKTGAYYGAGGDTESFASESVVKVLIAAELLATGQMSGQTETTAYQMITESDDDDADALYGLAGGDEVINDVAERYDIPFLGSPPEQAGWWGNTEINAKGMVYLYAAIAKDPVVGPWLINAMAHTSEYGADGTYQLFGIPSATTGAAVKQGWGDDGDDSPNAVFNSTGYVDDDRYAVAILTDGSPSTYGDTISAMLTQQAKTLMPGGELAPAAAAAATAQPKPAVASTPPAAGAVASAAPAASPAGHADLPVQASADRRRHAPIVRQGAMAATGVGVLAVAIATARWRLRRRRRNRAGRRRSGTDPGRHARRSARQAAQE